MTICQKKLHHAQKFQKQTYDKGIKSRSYGFALGNYI